LGAAATGFGAAGATLVSGFPASFVTVFVCDFKSIGFFCRAFGSALAAGLAAALTAGLPAFFVLIPIPASRKS